MKDDRFLRLVKRRVEYDEPMMYYRETLIRIIGRQNISMIVQRVDICIDR